ncbi:hypothetical protein BO221_14040 [Archangium sp. Cb G35]|uniref:hypothetical protein n=1 Tax=Archangium sp. Cb G35 TaxID=1920190 RepID=UPI0009363B4A|nr:hypothetical protein [Archangium sp. Cb G35]OJT24292.1 hypothetical protein BO221_14040 [Archangium sp. Cb G35]
MTPTQERVARARVAYTHAAHELLVATQAELKALHWLQVAEVTYGPASEAANQGRGAWRAAVEVREKAATGLRSRTEEVDQAQNALEAEARR